MTDTLDTLPMQNGSVLAGPAAPAYTAPHQLGATPPPPIASPIPVPDPTVHRLPSGHTVSLSSPRILTRAQRYHLIEVESGLPTVNAVLTWLVAAWSYPFAIPSADPASLDKIPGEDDDALTELAWAPVRALLFPKAASVDDHADETSPTAPSGA